MKFKIEKVNPWLSFIVVLIPCIVPTINFFKHTDKTMKFIDYFNRYDVSNIVSVLYFSVLLFFVIKAINRTKGNIEGTVKNMMEQLNHQYDMILWHEKLNLIRHFSVEYKALYENDNVAEIRYVSNKMLAIAHAASGIETKNAIASYYGIELEYLNSLIMTTIQ